MTKLLSQVIQISLLLCASVSAFQASSGAATAKVPTFTREAQHQLLPTSCKPISDPLLTNKQASSITALRGGAMTELITSTLQSGPYGVLGLTGVATSVVLPLTLYRQAYSFSVGYGFSVLAMGIVLMKEFSIPLDLSSPASMLTLAVLFYGARLGIFLLLREWTVPSKAKQLKEFDKSPLLKRIPLAIGVSMFYAFMTSPLMYALRGFGADGFGTGIVTKFGIGLAWFGAIVEALADGQKFLVKRSAKDEETFTGPTGGAYLLCRHPNYLGEVLFWLGLVVAGAPTFGMNVIPWLCGGLGFYGILGIMRNATQRLDDKQKEKYGGQKLYDDYREEVGSPIWPFIGGI